MKGRREYPETMARMGASLEHVSAELELDPALVPRRGSRERHRRCLPARGRAELVPQRAVSPRLRREVVSPTTMRATATSSRERATAASGSVSRRR